MENTKRLQKPDNYHMTFDLKGSTISRQVKIPQDQEKFWKLAPHCKKVLKDLNFLEISKDLGRSMIHMDPDYIDELNGLILEDSQFLASHNLMDYSLLFVIETEP